ncbi:hypothetical protein ABFV55_27450, partial [Pseudomonas syringae]|uniref:hypothetical protein n=1 Tax=Pseudomonas syringae TaxID=317 RepID=UPI0034D968A8
PLTIPFGEWAGLLPPLQPHHPPYLFILKHLYSTLLTLKGTPGSAQQNTYLTASRPMSPRGL